MGVKPLGGVAKCRAGEFRKERSRSEPQGTDRPVREKWRLRVQWHTAAKQSKEPCEALKASG